MWLQTGAPSSSGEEATSAGPKCPNEPQMFPQEVWSFESDEGCTDEQREDSQLKTRGEFPDSRMDYKSTLLNFGHLAPQANEPV
ncbi:hypothetical protein NQZ68_030727 [Dissostichus eleginoides]|nr:hypothetical protein NQZ68_030727 [Dissostichus eleginoides]